MTIVDSDAACDFSRTPDRPRFVAHWNGKEARLELLELINTPIGLINHQAGIREWLSREISSHMARVNAFDNGGLNIKNIIMEAVEELYQGKIPQLSQREKDALRSAIAGLKNRYVRLQEDKISSQGKEGLSYIPQFIRLEKAEFLLSLLLFNRILPFNAQSYTYAKDILKTLTEANGLTDDYYLIIAKANRIRIAFFIRLSSIPIYGALK